MYFKLNRLRFKTKVQKNNLNPKWDTTFTFALSKPLGSSSTLTASIYSATLLGRHQVRAQRQRLISQLLGTAKVQLAFLRGVGLDTQFYPLRVRAGAWH